MVEINRENERIVGCSFRTAQERDNFQTGVCRKCLRNLSEKRTEGLSVNCRVYGWEYTACEYQAMMAKS